MVFLLSKFQSGIDSNLNSRLRSASSSEDEKYGAMPWKWDKRLGVRQLWKSVLPAYLPCLLAAPAAAARCVVIASQAHFYLPEDTQTLVHRHMLTPLWEPSAQFQIQRTLPSLNEITGTIRYVIVVSFEGGAFQRQLENRPISAVLRASIVPATAKPSSNTSAFHAYQNHGCISHSS